MGANTNRPTQPNNTTTPKGATPNQILHLRITINLSTAPQTLNQTLSRGGPNNNTTTPSPKTLNAVTQTVTNTQGVRPNRVDPTTPGGRRATHTKTLQITHNQPNTNLPTRVLGHRRGRPDVGAQTAAETGVQGAEVGPTKTPHQILITVKLNSLFKG
jgi:hypothetical protein